MNFTYRNRIEGCLSNMSPHPVKVREVTFSMGEAAFHYWKYMLVAAMSTGARKSELEAHAQKFLCLNLTGPQLKSLGGKGRDGLMLVANELAIWSSECDRIQMEICQYKFDTYLEIKSVLRRLSGVLIIHSCRTPDHKMSSEHWAGRAITDETGKVTVIGGNTLGQMWMRLRDSM